MHVRLFPVLMIEKILRSIHVPRVYSDDQSAVLRGSFLECSANSQLAVLWMPEVPTELRWYFNKIVHPSVPSNLAGDLRVNDLQFLFLLIHSEHNFLLSFSNNCGRNNN